MQANKVVAIERESTRTRSIDAANRLYNLLQRARDAIFLVRDMDDRMTEISLENARASIERARLETSSVIRNLRRCALVLILSLIVFHNSDASEYLESYPGYFPHHHHTPAMPGVPGPTQYLMPDGGSWWIMPPAMPGFSPPPVYVAPDEPREYNIHHYYHSRRPGWRR